MNQNPFKSFDAAYAASLNNAYRAAESTSPRTRTLPEGKYQAMVIHFSLKESKRYADELNLMLGLEILDGQHKGATIYKFYNINPEMMARLKNDMLILGIDLQDNIVNLGEESTANAILDQVVDITIKHKQKRDGSGYFQNIYINRSLGKGGFIEVDDDESPFE